MRGVKRFADGQRLRRLSEDEYGGVGRTVRHAKDAGIWPAAVAVAHFLTVTGWRTGEVIGFEKKRS